MARTVLALAVILALTAVAGASAQTGNGPYSPFPTPHPSSRATEFYDQLGVALTPAEVRAGHFGAGLNASITDPGPAERAGLDGGSSGLVAFAGVVIVALLAAGVAARRSRRRTT